MAPLKSLILCIILFFIGCKDSNDQRTIEKENPIDFLDKNATEILEEFPFFDGSMLCDCESFPQPTGWVNDFENLLPPEEETRLNDLIQAYTDSTSNQIALITTPHPFGCSNWRLLGQEIGNCWGVGEKGKDNGVVFIVSRNMKNTFIATGTKTEEILTDSICDVIVNEKLTPFFRDSNYVGGITGGLEEITRIFN